ncbi:MAG: 4-(cytidine 5'-diphospho)-2-C-methyl-D-erythritol kinase, partial [Micrococcaceae bacterium]|nr:4-(cytidine 5'-diphospho)-2-C-methyl-D-erythritol kinase [Micrococcaceae bacterium]
MNQTVVARAPGKINIYFRVGAPREDGYHPVASLYLAVSLFEDVAATARTDGRITVA